MIFNALILTLLGFIAINTNTRNSVANSWISKTDNLPEKFWIRNELLFKIYIVKPKKITIGNYLTYCMQTISTIIIILMYTLYLFGVVNNLLLDTHSPTIKLLLILPIISYFICNIIETIINKVFKHKQKNKILSTNEKINYFLNDRNERIDKCLELKLVSEYLTYQEFYNYFLENEDLIDFTYGEIKLRLTHYKDKYSYQINNDKTHIFESGEACIDNLLIDNNNLESIWNMLY